MQASRAVRRGARTPPVGIAARAREPQHPRPSMGQGGWPCILQGSWQFPDEVIDPHLSVELRDMIQECAHLGLGEGSEPGARWLDCAGSRRLGQD